MEIRKALREDADAWHSLVLEVKSENLPTLFAMAKPITPESSREYLGRILAAEGSFVLLCVEDGRIAGSVDVIRKGRPEECHVAEIGMCVRKEYRNRGVGGRLLEGVFEACRREGKISKIELDVFSNNSAGMHLYEKKGFVYEGRRKGSIKKDGEKLDLVMMGRQV